jgi:glycerophosphoryl diester phosphodiesterase
LTDGKRTPSGRIFISYRRQDSAYPAGWLFDHLADRFGPEQVFKDVDSIELGDDFVEEITNAVGSCDVVLALIGKKWLRVGGAARRLDDPNDFVRLEIEAALERRVLLIPILVDGAVMPKSDQLPPSIAPLVRRQALELSPNRFRTDTAHLLNVLERTLTDLREKQPLEEQLPEEQPVEQPLVEVQPEEQPVEEAAPAKPDSSAVTPPVAPPHTPPREAPHPEPRRSFRARWVVAGVAAIVAAAALVVVILNGQPDDPQKPPGSQSSAPVPTPPQLGRVGGPIVLAHRGGFENFAWETLPAFTDAAKMGAAVETDVRWTKDGVAVLVHDAGTSPGMECGAGNHIVAETDWPVLRDDCLSPAAASTDGKRYGIPTFGDALSALSQIPGAQIYPEVKVVQNPTQVRQFVGFLTNMRMTDRAVVTSVFPEELAKIRARAERDGLAIRLMQFVSKQPVPVADLAGGLWGVAVNISIATDGYVKELQAAGLKVMLWTVNTPPQWERVDQLGADLVMTDKPKEYGAWVKGN